MEIDYEAKYHTLEKTHWWFKGRRAMLLALLRNFPKQATILEIGCSGGILLRLLQQRGFTKVTGIDISKKAIQVCKKQALPNVFAMDGAKTKFSDEQFDVIIASDVLEHIKQDKAALAEWKRILKPGGTLFVFVPAFPFLWTAHDERNQHYRRYVKKPLSSLLQHAGFHLTRTSYWNFSLFFPATLLRTLFSSKSSKAKQKDDLHAVPSLLNSMLFFLLKIENLVLKLVNFPVGISVFAIAKK